MELVGVGRLGIVLCLSVAVAQSGHRTLLVVAEHSRCERSVDVVVQVGQHLACGGEQGDGSAVALVEHQLADAAVVTVEACHIAACRGHDGQARVGGVQHIVGCPQAGGREAVGSGMTDVGGKVLPLAEHLLDVPLGLGRGAFGFFLERFGRVLWEHAHEGHVANHLCLAIVVDDVAYTRRMRLMQLKDRVGLDTDDNVRSFGWCPSSRC